MEVLKKTILQAVTTGITACTGTTGTCYVIIPDLNAVYYMKIGLKQDAHDLGFFDAFQSYYGYDGENQNDYNIFIPIGLDNLY